MGLDYLLDTDIVILALKAKPEISELEKLDQQGGAIGLSVITVYEIYEGIYGSQRVPVEESEETFKGFVDKYIEKFLFIDKEASIVGGKIRAQLRRTGRVITDTDILIAATCLVNGLTLVTRNKKHFSRIKELRLF